MRERIFRAIPIDETEFIVCNGFMKHSNGKIIVPFNENEDMFMTKPINPETLGEFINRKDINGIRICEGDILTREERGCDNSKQQSTYVVFWKNDKYMLRTIKSTIFKPKSETYLTDCNFKIIGNIHQNQELL